VFRKEQQEGIEMKTALRVALALLAALTFADAASAQIGPMVTPTATPAVTPTPTPAYVPITPPASAVTASTHDGNGPGNVVDNSLGTRWAGNGDGAWLRLDLGRPMQIGYVTIAVYRGNERANLFDLQVSDDGMTWSDLRSPVASSGTTTQQERYDFNDRVGRYVRYLGHGHQPRSGGPRGTWNSLTEVDVYGVDPPAGLPAPPADLQAFPSSGQVTLRWSASSSASSYRVWRRLSQCDTYGLVGISNDGSNTFVDAGVTDGQHYYYVVSSVNAAGEGPRSEPVAVTPRLQPPPPPVFSATSAPTGITLTWSTVPTALRYTIRRGERKPHCRYFVLNWQTLAVVQAPATSYTDTAIESGRTYVYSMSATNATAEGAQSPTRDVLSAGTPVPTPVETPCPTPTTTPTPVPPTAPPPAPTITSTRPGDGRVQITWQANGVYPNFPRSFHVYRASGPCGPFLQIAWSAVGNTYTATGLLNGTSYYFVVVGVNARGESLDSSVVSAIPVAIPPQAPPESLNARQISPNAPAVRLSWRSTWDADSYVVGRATTRGGPYTTIASAVPNDPNRTFIEYDDGSVAYGTTYYYVVTAVNTAGESGSSGEASITPAQRPAAPNLRVTPGNGQMTLHWDPVPTAVSYSCRFATQRGGPYWFSTPTVTTTSVVVMNLTNGTTYYAICWATNAAGNGPSSNEVLAIPRAEADIIVTPPASGVSASTHDGNAPGNTVDDDFSSRWSGYGNGASLSLDLGTTRTVTRLAIAVFRGDERRNRFDLQYSADGTTWHPLVAGAETSGSTLTQELVDVPDTPTRYLRYVGRGNVMNTGSTGLWNSVTEIDVFASP
jgi:fibronectin type 3 domain-containing protein